MKGLSPFKQGQSRPDLVWGTVSGGQGEGVDGEERLEVSGPLLLPWSKGVHGGLN